MTTMIRSAPLSAGRASRRLAIAARRPFARHPWALEIALFALALAIYQGSRALVIGDPSTAFENAAGIIDWEQSSGLFFEVTIQRWVLEHLELTAALNWFYMYAHWTVTPAFFVWLYRRRHAVYPYVRNAFFLANGIALLIYTLFPVAPPRLVGGAFVDTLYRISDIDLHGGALAGWFNPNAAVPSMHFGYALMIGMVCVVLMRNWPMRILAATYPALVFVTITGTANHYVLDAIAGAVVVATGFIVTWAVMGPGARRVRRLGAPLGVSVPGVRRPVA